MWVPGLAISAPCCSVTQLCPHLFTPMDSSTPGFPVLHHLRELAQTHVHWVSNAIQPSHPLLSPSSPAFNFSQHQGLFQWVSSSHQLAKVLELQLHGASAPWDSSHWPSLSQISLLGLLRLSELHHDLGFSSPNPASSLCVFLRCYPQ